MNHDFGKRLREARKQCGWSQKWVADKAGMHQTKVSAIEGGRTVTLDDAIKLAGIVGISLTNNSVRAWY